MNSYLQNVSDISTHSLTRRLTISHDTFLFLYSYFNSQPHKEADVVNRNIWHPFHISTHSLTRRLTAGKPVLVPESDISTHSLTRRLTTS